MVLTTVQVPPAEHLHTPAPTRWPSWTESNLLCPGLSCTPEPLGCHRCHAVSDKAAPCVCAMKLTVT